MKTFKLNSKIRTANAIYSPLFLIYSHKINSSGCVTAKNKTELPCNIYALYCVTFVTDLMAMPQRKSLE